MAADNDLSPYALWDIYEMEHKIADQANLGASSASVDVVVELDTYKRDGINRYHVLQSNESYDHNLTIDDFEKSDIANIKSPLIETLPETGPGSLRDQSRRFEEFLNWGMRKFPAKRYIVVVWGHGEGYIGKHYERRMRRENVHSRIESRFLNISNEELNSSERIPSKYPVNKVAGGIAFDYSELSFIDMPTLANVLYKTSKNVLEGKKIDILTFDACLMQSIEVATELTDSTQYLLGSNQIQNYLGLPYRALLDRLNHSPDSRSEVIASDFVTITSKSFSSGGYQASIDPSARETYTMSAISLPALSQQLLPALSDVSQAISNYLTDDALNMMELGFIFQSTPSIEGETKDLGQFLGMLKMLLWTQAQNEGETRAGSKLRIAIDEALSVLQATMIEYAYGEQYIQLQHRQEDNWLLGFFKGISVWMPKNREAFEYRYKEMQQSKFFTTDWNAWMKDIHSATLPF